MKLVILCGGHALKGIGVTGRRRLANRPAEVHWLAGDAHQLEHGLRAFAAVGGSQCLLAFGRDIIDRVLFRFENVVVIAHVLHGYHYIIQRIFRLVTYYDTKVFDTSEETGFVITKRGGDELRPIAAVVGAPFDELPGSMLLHFLPPADLLRHVGGLFKAFTQVAVFVEQSLVFGQYATYAALLLAIAQRYDDH